MPDHFCSEMQQIRRHFLNRSSHLVNLGLHKQLKYFLKIISLVNIKHLVIRQFASQGSPKPSWILMYQILQWCEFLDLWIIKMALTSHCWPVRKTLRLFGVTVCAFFLSLVWPKNFGSPLVSYTIKVVHGAIKIDFMCSWFIHYESYFSELYILPHRAKCLSKGLGCNTKPLTNLNLE